MRAGHHQLALAIGAGDLGDRVVGLEVVVVEAGADVDLELHLVAALEQPGQPIVVLGGHHQTGRTGLLARLAGAAAADAHDAGAPAAHLDGGEHSLFGEELAQLLAEAIALDRLLAIVGRLAIVRHRILGELFELLAAVAAKLGTLGLRRVVLVVEEEDHAAQLAAVLLEVAPPRRARPAWRARAPDRRSRASTPSAARAAASRAAAAVHRGAVEAPAAPEPPPRLDPRVGQAPRGHPIARPLVGRAQSRRAGEPGTDHVGEIGERLHHPRATQSLAADAVDHVPVDRLLGAECRCERQRERDRGRRARSPRGRTRWKLRAQLACAVVGSIIRLTSVTFVAGKPLRLACSRITSSFSAM